MQLKKNFPLFLILLLAIATYNYTSIFIKIDLDEYYGKYVGKKAYDFNLKMESGKYIRLSSFKGKFLLLTFGFTKCTGICPINLNRFQKLSEKISSKDLSNINFAFISFDKIRDDKKDMKDFLNNFNIPNMYGLLSGKDNGLEVARKYKNHINYDISKIKNNSKFQINHNGFLYLINPTGELSIVYMQQDIDEEKIIQDIQKLMSKGEG